MRRFSSLLLISVTCILILAGCSADQTPSGTQISEKTEITAQEAVPSSETGNILVMYFSRTGEQYSVGKIEKGNTAIVAEMISEMTGAESYEILPADDYYPDSYDELTEIAKQEQTDQARPDYRPLPDITEYDTVFIGSPVWWADWPMIMYHIFETNDFSDKTLIPFNTNEGSGMAGFDEKLKEECPESEVLSGLAVKGHDAQNNPEKVKEDVKNWLEKLGY